MAPAPGEEVHVHSGLHRVSSVTVPMLSDRSISNTGDIFLNNNFIEIWFTSYTLHLFKV